MDYQDDAKMQRCLGETDEPEKLSPVISISQKGTIGQIIKKEIDKLFLHQTEEWR